MIKDITKKQELLSELLSLQKLLEIKFRRLNSTIKELKVNIKYNPNGVYCYRDVISITNQDKLIVKNKLNTFLKTYPKRTFKISSANTIKLMEWAFMRGQLKEK